MLIKCAHCGTTTRDGKTNSARSGTDPVKLTLTAHSSSPILSSILSLLLCFPLWSVTLSKTLFSAADHFVNGVLLFYLFLLLHVMNFEIPQNYVAMWSCD